MLSNKEFFTSSVTNNLIYLKLFKSFCINIQLAFLESNSAYSDTASQFFRDFEKLSNQLLKYADRSITQEILENELLVTKYSIRSIIRTEELFHIKLPIEITEVQLTLEAGIPHDPTQEELTEIMEINKESLNLCINFEDYLANIFELETKGELFSYSYPFLIRRMTEEISLFIIILERIMSKLPSDPKSILDYEYKSANLFKSFAMFIRSFVDPSREDIIRMAQSYIIEYEHLIDEYRTVGLSPANQMKLTSKNQKLTKRFADFMGDVLNKYLNAEIYLIVEPLLVDNMYRSIKIGEYFMFHVKETIISSKDS